MAVGRTIDVKWIHEGKLYTGDFCTAQGKFLHEPFAKSLNSFVTGAVQQLGETGSALATLVGSFVFYISLSLTRLRYHTGHRHPYLHSCLLGNTQAPIYHRICYSWSYVALRWPFCGIGCIPEHTRFQLLRNS